MSIPRAERLLLPGDPVPGSGGRPKGCTKELRELIGWIEQAGGVVRPSGQTGHWKVYFRGQYIGGLVGTPGSKRSWRNDIARLRRGGLQIDSKGRPL